MQAARAHHGRGVGGLGRGERAEAGAEHGADVRRLAKPGRVARAEQGGDDGDGAVFERRLGRVGLGVADVPQRRRRRLRRALGLPSRALLQLRDEGRHGAEVEERGCHRARGAGERLEQRGGELARLVIGAREAGHQQLLRLLRHPARALRVVLAAECEESAGVAAEQGVAVRQHAHRSVHRACRVRWGRAGGGWGWEVGGSGGTSFSRVRVTVFF